MPSSRWPLASGRMRRLLALPLIVLLAVAGCGDDKAASDDEPVVTDGIDQAVEVAKLSLPATLSDDIVATLIEDLCASAGSGDVDAVVAQLQGAGVDAADSASTLDALAAGAGTWCPDDVDDVVPQVQQALAPTPSSTVPAAAAAAGGGSGSSSSASSSSSGGGSNTGSAQNSSCGLGQRRAAATPPARATPAPPTSPSPSPRVNSSSSGSGSSARTSSAPLGGDGALHRRAVQLAAMRRRSR